ncbi:hypothetical protein E2C01_067442 [Portunus trituberculatus]|uniref:Uncharacterized protein n=1 Tax=Portunus trituberculatus TaxID=210409 RepID=A0A5B7HSM3_PORTR|nr:hypothetical protein [Portunus trituberculatus]
MHTFSNLIPTAPKSLEEGKAINSGDGTRIQHHQLLRSILCQHQWAPSWVCAACQAQHHLLFKLLGQKHQAILSNKVTKKLKS